MTKTLKPTRMSKTMTKKVQSGIPMVCELGIPGSYNYARGEVQLIRDNEWRIVITVGSSTTTDWLYSIEDVQAKMTEFCEDFKQWMQEDS